MIDKTAIIDPSAVIDESAIIGPNVVIGKNVKIGARTRVIANAYIEYSYNYSDIDEDAKTYYNNQNSHANGMIWEEKSVWSSM